MSGKCCSTHLALDTFGRSRANREVVPNASAPGRVAAAWSSGLEHLIGNSTYPWGNTRGPCLTRVESKAGGLGHGKRKIFTESVQGGAVGARPGNGEVDGVKEREGIGGGERDLG